MRDCRDDWRYSGHRARLSPDAIALIHVPTGRQFTYAELNRRALQCARVWTDLCALAPGDRLCILSENRVSMLMRSGRRANPASSSSRSGHAARPTSCNRSSPIADRAASCIPHDTRNLRTNSSNSFGSSAPSILTPKTTPECAELCPGRSSGLPRSTLRAVTARGHFLPALHQRHHGTTKRCNDSAPADCI